MEFLESDMDELYREAVAKAEAEGAYSHDAWRSVVDAVLEDRAQFGEIHDDDMEEIRENLMNRYADFDSEHRK